MKRIAPWLCIVSLLCLPSVTNAALPTVEQLRGLFTRAGLAMDETSEASDPQTYYTLTARGVVEVSLPWWATLSAVSGESDPALISACSEGSSMSPTRSAENPP